MHHHLGVGHYCRDKVHGGDAHVISPKSGFVEAVYSACGELRIGGPQMGYGCKPLEGQNNSHKAHMPGFILPQVFRVICCPAPTLLFVWGRIWTIRVGCMCVYTTSGVN